MITEEQEAKLPRYARTELERLRADLAYTQHKLKALAGGTDGGLIFRDPYSDGPIAIARGDETLGIGTRDRPWGVMTMAWRPNSNSYGAHLEISSTDGLMLHPQASNAALILPWRIR